MPSTRRQFVQSSLALAQRRLPNILFILADDLGYGDLGCRRGGRQPLADARGSEGRARGRQGGGQNCLAELPAPRAVFHHDYGGRLKRNLSMPSFWMRNSRVDGF